MILRLLYWFRRWRYKLHELEDGRCALSKKNIYNRTYYDFKAVDHTFWWPKRHRNFRDCLTSASNALRVYTIYVGNPTSDVGTIVSYKTLAAKTKLRNGSL